MVKRGRLFSLKKTPTLGGLWSRSSKRSLDCSASTSASTASAPSISRQDDAPSTSRGRQRSPGPCASPPGEIERQPSHGSHGERRTSPDCLSHSDSLTVFAGNLSPEYRHLGSISFSSDVSSLGVASPRHGGGGLYPRAGRRPGDKPAGAPASDGGPRAYALLPPGGCLGSVYSVGSASYEVEVDQERDDVNEFVSGGTSPGGPVYEPRAGQDWTPLDGAALLLRSGLRRKTWGI